MVIKTTTPSVLPLSLDLTGRRKKLQDYPWWLLGILLLVLGTFYLILTQPNFKEAFSFIKAGLGLTLSTTFVAFGVALIIGLLAGLGRISSNVVIKNIATLYIELIRGVPMLVLIFVIAIVAVPAIVTGLNAFGAFLSRSGITFLAGIFSGINIKDVPMNARAITALATTYGAFLAEIFRAGIESIGKGQMEAARSQGMSYVQAMRYIILPQAVRNVLPALGNDFISMLKDSSLVSILAVRDITQVTRLYTGQTFRYTEAYTTLAILYLTMTVILSLLVKTIEGKLRRNEQS
ncbi:amino acid ABC transporter membrane protein, PAAT family [Longilinea arvoryzae]|uniref:Amino acid ABC transporter membrane protein, PAAT family n=1 Tax=Longilinea arvoryzae TaxID=360412 RepID=A0A0S7BM49_9CHLR|nr:amino acid ABC transporter membrane protein, PAAT family [Longilinea arvoryzae]